MQTNQLDVEEGRARIAAIQAAMMEELGIGRKDDLPLQDRGPSVSLAQLRQALPRRALPSAVVAWNNIVFDDVDPTQDHLDSMEGGQLYRIRKQAQGPERNDLQGRRRRHGASSMHASGEADMLPARHSGRAFATTSSRIDTTVARLRAKSNRAASELANKQPRPIAKGNNRNFNDVTSITDTPRCSSSSQSRGTPRDARRPKPSRLTEGPGWALASATTFSLGPMQPTSAVPSLQLLRQPHSLAQPTPVVHPVPSPKKEETYVGDSASKTIRLPSGGGLVASRWAAAESPLTPYPPSSEQTHPARFSQSKSVVPAAVTSTAQPNKVEAVASLSLKEGKASTTGEATKLKRKEIRTFSAEVRIGNGLVRHATIRLTRISESHPAVLEINVAPGMQRIFTDCVPVDAGLQLQGSSVLFRHNDPAGLGQSYWALLFQLPHYAEAFYGRIDTDEFRPTTGGHDFPKKQVSSNNDFASSNEKSASQEPSWPADDELKALNDDLVVGHFLRQLDSRYDGSFLNSLFVVVEESAKECGMEITLGIEALIEAILLSSEHLAAARVLVYDLLRESESYIELEEEFGGEYLNDMSWKVLAKALLVRDDGLAKTRDSEADHAYIDPTFQDGDEDPSPPDAKQSSTSQGSTTSTKERESPNDGSCEEGPTTPIKVCTHRKGNNSSRVTYQVNELWRLRPNAANVEGVLLSRQEIRNSNAKIKLEDDRRAATRQKTLGGGSTFLESGGFHDIIPLDFSGNPGLGASRWAPPEAKARTQSKPSFEAPPRSQRLSVSHPQVITSLVTGNSDLASGLTSPVDGSFIPASPRHAPTAAAPPTMKEEAAYIRDEASGQMKEVKAYMPIKNASVTRQENVRLPTFPPSSDMHHQKLSESFDINAFSQQGFKEPGHSHGHQDAGWVGLSRPELLSMGGNGVTHAPLQSRLDQNINRG